MSIGIYFLFFCSMLAVSTSPLIALYLDNQVDPISIAFWRMAIGALVLYIYSFTNKKFKPINSKNSLKTFISGILLGLHFALFYGAISLLPNNATNATVFGTLAPFFALFIEIYFGRKIDRKIYFGLFIILCGSFIMFIEKFNFNSDLTQGNLLAILCSLCFAVVFILSDQVRKTNSALSFSRAIFLYAAATLLVIALLKGVNLLEQGVYKYKFFLLFLGIIPTLVGHSVFYYLVKYLPPTVVACIPLGEPFIFSMITWFILPAYFPNQELNSYIIIGGLLTLVGLFILIQSKKK